MSKHYARVSDYGDLLIPIGLLEKVVAECMIVNTGYIDGKDTIEKLKKIERVHIHCQEEVDAALVQQALEGNEN